MYIIAIFYIFVLDGFSKRVSDGDHTSNHGTSCEYAHPYFMKDHPCLLLSIKQKRGEKVVSFISLSNLINEFKIILL